MLRLGDKGGCEWCVDSVCFYHVVVVKTTPECV